MGTRDGNSAAGNATGSIGASLPEQYSADNLITYRVSLSLVDRLASEGALTAAERRKAYTIIAKRHGLSLDSIFAENA